MDRAAEVGRWFDLRSQVDEHPWEMVGGSLVAGFLAGSLAGSLSAGGRQRWGGQRGFCPAPERPGRLELHLRGGGPGAAGDA
jgi:hypothetical protein